uniref:Movement protein n=7 Tax=Raspberry rubodvirus 1 TaxID=3231632 RepID=A0AAU8JNK4_9VIRU
MAMNSDNVKSPNDFLSGISSSPLSDSDFPVYKDDARLSGIREMIRGNKSLEEAYEAADASKNMWVQHQYESSMQALSQMDSEFTLGNLYQTKDLWVKKNAEADIAVTGGKSEIQFRPINPDEKRKMEKKYKALHLDGFEISCQSYMPQGSKGFAIVSLYDERFVSPEEGFLGLIGFPLSERNTTATCKLNYCVSTKDSKNWVAIITVYEHGLLDSMTPCNFHLQTTYKYTNNLERFAQCSEETDKGGFRVPINAEKTCFAQQSVRNALDYSMSVLLNKKFMKQLSDREINVLRNSANFSMVNDPGRVLRADVFRSSQRPGLRMIDQEGNKPEARRSTSLNMVTSPVIDFSKVVNIHEDQQSQKGKEKQTAEPSCLKMTKDQIRALLEQMNIDPMAYSPPKQTIPINLPSTSFDVPPRLSCTIVDVEDDDKSPCLSPA